MGRDWSIGFVCFRLFPEQPLTFSYSCTGERLEERWDFPQRSLSIYLGNFKTVTRKRGVYVEIGIHMVFCLKT